MKTTIRSIAFLGVMLCSGYAILAQTTSSTTTTTTASDGTITQFTQDGMVIRSAT